MAVSDEQLPAVASGVALGGDRQDDAGDLEGRAVFFRPRRYSAVELAPLIAAVDLALGGAARPCVFRNVSRSGIALDVDADPTIALGAAARFTLRLDGQAVHAGEARVERLVPSGPRTMIGLSFAEPLDIDDVVSLRDLTSYHEQAGAGRRLSRQAWHAAGHERFKSLVAELRLLLEDTSAQLSDLESTLAPGVLSADRPSLTQAALVPWLEREFTDRVVDFSERIDAALRGAADGDWHALKEFSVRHLHSFLSQAPAMHRAYLKPSGYPGDYELMNYVYERSFEGRNLFARAMNLAFYATALGQALRARKDAMKAELHALAARSIRLGRPLRVLSVVAGPAPEIREWLAELDDGTAIEIVLFDQDHDALGHAHERVKAAAAAGRRREVRISARHDSLKRLLTDENIFADLGKFDAVLCPGFFDYLRGPKAIALARTLGGSLGAGGTAYIGNIAPSCPSRWLMEHHLDWYLIYKTRDEILDFAGRALPGARVEILEDAAGLSPIAAVRRA